MKEAIITINSLKCRARIGCTEEERAFPQAVEFDIEMTVVGKAPMSDSLSDTVDYMAVAELITQMCEEKEWRLVEKLSADIGTEILNTFQVVRRVKVLMRKYIIPQANYISCEVQVEGNATL